MAETTAEMVFRHQQEEMQEMQVEDGLTREELQARFHVERFGLLDSNGYGESVVFVTEKQTGERGSMSFSGSPRRYFDFKHEG